MPSPGFIKDAALDRHGPRGLIASLALAACLIGSLAALAAVGSPARAATCESQNNYTGAPGGAWSEKENWSKKAVPTTSETVCIPPGSGTIEVGASVKGEAKSIKAQSPVKIASTGSLTLSETVESSLAASTFAGLDIEAGGHLITAGGWLFLSGTNTLNGEISTSKVSSGYVRLLSGNLTGNGTIAVQFGNEGGTIEPGGPGVIGDLHFTSLSGQQEKGTLILDIASSSSFDRLTDATSNFFLGGTLQINLIDGYEPPVKTKFQFMSGGPGDSVEFEHVPAGYLARSFPGGAEVEVAERPPTAVTEAATEITQKTATINGSVNPNLQAVTICELEFGTAEGVYGTSSTCPVPPGSGSAPVGESVAVSNLTPGTTYHYRIIAINSSGQSKGLDRSFTTLAAGKEETAGGHETKSAETTTGPGQTPSGGGSPAATEELLRGCSTSPLVLNDVYIHGSRVALLGSAAKSLVGKTVKILFNEKKQVATATVGADGQFSTSAPLPPKKIREALTTRYTAEIGSVRSLHVKLTRRLLLEPPKASGTTVTLTGTVAPPLTKPIAPIVVEERLQCGKVLIAAHVTPPKNGRFKITVTVPPGTGAALYQLKSTVAANPHATKHGFTTFSLQLPVTIG